MSSYKYPLTVWTRHLLLPPPVIFSRDNLTNERIIYLVLRILVSPGSKQKLNNLELAFEDGPCKGCHVLKLW